jgi:hypothetical protein
MSKKKQVQVHVEEKKVQRTEYIIEVPTADQKELSDFFQKNLSLRSETDQWIMEDALRMGLGGKSTFKVCFRSPAELDLSNRIFWRVWDFNKELLGETLSPQQVFRLCWAIAQLDQTHPLFMACGVNFHVLSDVFEAGKYRGCLLDIGFDHLAKKPQVFVGHFSSPLYFNPTSYYGVLIK